MEFVLDFIQYYYTKFRITTHIHAHTHTNSNDQEYIVHINTVGSITIVLYA